MSKITADMAGCWIDGAAGIFATSALVELALNYGGYLRGFDRTGTMRARTEARHVIRAYNAGQDATSYRIRPRHGASYTATITDVFEHLVGLADDAKTFLNTLAPEGYSFGWLDGEFFLDSAAWWEASE